MMKCLLIPSLGLLAGLAALAATPAPPPATAPAKKTLAVLSFSGTDAASRDLADRMRFAVSQKLSRDGAWDRKDNVEVDNAVSALQVTIDQTDPSAAEMVKLAKILEVDYVITGHVKGRTLTLTMYQGGVAGGSAVAEIPPDKESPRLAVEKVLTDLAGVSFQHIREVEADKTDPATEARWASRPNLAPDPGFEEAAAKKAADSPAWGAILGASRYAPKLCDAAGAKALAEDTVAIVPASVVGDAANAAGNCLMMRVSKNVAENNGLACESIWIPVEAGVKYRFAAQYHSTGPTLRVFLKGFAEQNDEFVDNSTPERALESTRREYYRAQVLPRGKNRAFEAVEMDFTPSSDKKDLPIRWMRVDFFVYLSAGDVFLDNVVVKKIGP